MSARVPAGPSFMDGVLLASALAGTVALGVGGLVTLLGKGGAWVPTVWLVACAAFCVTLARGGWIVLRGKWIAAAGVGLRLTTWRGELDIMPADVTRLDTEVTVVQGKDGPEQWQRRVVFEANVPTLRRPVRLRYRWPLTSQDPLADLFDRLLNRLAAHTDRELEGGGRLAGEGWVVTRGELTVGSGADAVTVPTRAITAEVIDGTVLLWEAGADEPRLVVPEMSANARLLQRVLTSVRPAARRPDPPRVTTDWEYVDEPPPSADPPTGTAEGGLGPVLFSRGWPAATARLYARRRARAAVLLPLGLLGLVGIGSILYWLDSLLLLPFGLLAIPALWHGGLLALAVLLAPRWRGQFRCHTGGVSKQTWEEITRLRFDELTEFTFDDSAVVAGRALLSREVRVRFEAADGRAVKHRVELAAEEPDLEWLKEYAGKLLAVEMKRRLDDGEVVPWTERVTFEPDGVSVSVGDDSDDDLLLDWDDCRLLNVAPGQFTLLSRRTGRLVAELSTSAVNFFPGYYLLEKMQPAAI